MKKVFLAAVAIVWGISALAQTTLRVEAPNVVAADEQFNVTFVLEGEDSPSDFQWSQGGDFQLVWGPQQGRSTSVQIINGKRTKSSQFTYTYILRPLKTGKFTLPQARAKVKGKELVSDAAVIEVVSNGSSSSGAASSSASGAGSGNAGAGRSDNVSGISDDDIFMRLDLSRTNVVVGEPITATLKLYQRVNIAGFEDARFPSFNGFWSQEIEAPTNIEFRRESYDDKIYNTAVLRKYVLIPQQSGSITIDPAELVCLVNIRVSSGGSASIFDGFFDDYRTIRKRVYSSSYKINVSPLPSGAPASFGGGVGDFTISAQLSKDSLVTHEAASLVVTIKGKGNVSLLEAPKVTFPPDFEVYDTKVSERTDKGSGGTSGSKTYEYPFIPRSHGDFALAPITYSYYDISEGRYVTLKTDPIPFTVVKGNESSSSSSQVSVPSVTRHGVKSLNEDIRYIRTKLPQFSSKGDFFVGSGLFWGLSVAAVIISVLVWLLLRAMAARRADVAGTKTRKATKMALKRLRLAGDYLKQNLYTAFYEELHKALLGFISDKLNIPVADLSKEKVADALAGAGVDEKLVNDFVGLIDACEFARYSPDAGHDAMNAHYQDAINVISSMDSMMKGKKNNHASKTAAMAIIFMLVIPFSASAAGDAYIDSLWTNATAAYSEGRWADAIDGYTSVAKSGLESAALYCNIGSAYFKAEDYPHAILYYERALKLDPSYSDARYNLEVVSGFIQDRIDPVPEFVLKTWAKSVCYILDSDAWAALFIVFLLLAGLMTVVLLLSARTAWKRTGFFSGIVFLLLAVASISFSLWQKNDYMSADRAVVMRPVTSVKSSPSDEASTDLFILHEGTAVRILDAVGDWNNIELADGRQGWILSEDIEVI
ncbi:MAG: BatD family protein [Bacteroidetes bacterium]|uniref:BatD family protein n=1 Tax=Candidatus Cryptobacteroides merdavium TaxID=2840769 RepID=A0A9D9HBP8_9BACT|nr:BatD family protein [Candidatus Cryptobacteroides merdavium]